MSIEQAILREWIREARDEALKHKRRRLRDPLDRFESGALIAYYEMLSSLRNVAEGFGFDLHEYGLDFDLDEELLVPLDSNEEGNAETSARWRARGKSTKKRHGESYKRIWSARGECPALPPQVGRC